MWLMNAWSPIVNIEKKHYLINTRLSTNEFLLIKKRKHSLKEQFKVESNHIKTCIRDIFGKQADMIIKMNVVTCIYHYVHTFLNTMTLDK